MAFIFPAAMLGVPGMRIGLLADTHDATEPTAEALSRLEDAGAEVLLHAGDLITDRTIPLYEGWTVWMAQGNGDWPERIEQAIAEHEVDVRYASEHALELDGARVGLIHGAYDGQLERMIADGGHDLVVHGHTHRFRDERIGGTRVVNPGAVWRAQRPSVCLYETRKDTLERFSLDR